MRKKLLFIVLSLLILQAAPAQKTSALVQPDPKAAGFAPERLGRIDQAMDEWVKNGWMNGGAALVIRNGRIAYYHAAGFNDLDSKTALRPDDIFRIASQTKAITSVAAMMLFDEGRLLLSDPVSKFIPSFRNMQVLASFDARDTSYTTVPARRDITIKDLLTHTSGIGYAQIGSRESNAIYAKHNITAGLQVSDRSLLDAMTELGKLPLLHQPGDKWTYGLNIDLLGCIIEIVSGMSLDEFFRTRIFVPIGMKDTYFTIPPQKANRLVNLYTEDSTGHLVKSPGKALNGAVGPDYPLRKTAYFSGGAGLSSTLYDYGIFLQMLLNGGEYNGKRLLGRNTVRMMTMAQTGSATFRGNDDFGLGFQIVGTKNGDVPAQAGTFSWGGAFATSYWVDPSEKIVMLFYRQLQRSTHGDVVEKFRSMVYAALSE